MNEAISDLDLRSKYVAAQKCAAPRAEKLPLHSRSHARESALI
jgi:hypothetical protein